MSSVNRNLVANFVGKAWAGVVSLLFLPVYARLMGIEAYGLVGFYATLLATLGILDLGFSTTLNRELARAAAAVDPAEKSRDLLRSLEAVYWLGALSIPVIVWLSAPLIATHWVQARSLPVSVIERSVALMGLTVSAQMLLGFYGGGILGLQRQVLYNVYLAGFSTFRAVGAIGTLVLVAATPVAFFVWQAIVTVVGVVALATLLWRLMPRAARRPRVRLDAIRGVMHFAAGMSGTAVIGLVVGQLDKLILSKNFPLSVFGYYSLAVSISGALQYLGGPIYTTFFPAFASGHARGDQYTVRSQYHLAAQVLALAVIPVAAVLILFSREAMLLWTHSAQIASQTQELTAVMSVAVALNVVASVPYALQLSHGWTSLGFWTNLVAAIILAPMLVVGIRIAGPLGAAWVSVCLNLGYVITYATLMHRRLLVQDRRRWLVDDLLRPAAAVAVVGVGLRLLAPHVADVPLALVLAFAYATMAATAFLALPVARSAALGQVARFRALA